MDSERWHEVDGLFAEALDRLPAQRLAFLAEACAGDSVLRQEVERLLAADQESSQFLSSSPGELLKLVLDSREEGGSLGPYRLLRTLGSGGMGTVYLARREDEHYQREVAIKVLRSGLATTEAFHRFLAERQILAQLEHPNIARLYDGGESADGSPYIVMEYVDGLPLFDWADETEATLDGRLTRTCWSIAISSRRTSWSHPRGSRSCWTSGSPSGSRRSPAAALSRRRGPACE